MIYLRNYFNKAFFLVVFIGFNTAHAGSYEDFFRAIRRDDGGTIRQLLQRGFDANSLDPEGRTGLTLALREAYLKVSDTLISWPQTDVNLANREGETPLMLAAVIGEVGLAEKLIKKGADINKTGWTPLHYAASKGQVPVIRLLLENSAYIDAESPNKTTPLMMAAMYGSPESVRVLLEEGADPTLKNSQNLTALNFAQNGERPDAIKMLTALTAPKPAPAPVRLQAPPPAPSPVPKKAEATDVNPYWREPETPAPRNKPVYWFGDSGPAPEPLPKPVQVPPTDVPRPAAAPGPALPEPAKPKPAAQW